MRDSVNSFFFVLVSLYEHNFFLYNIVRPCHE